jgi:hypothetical protein
MMPLPLSLDEGMNHKQRRIMKPFQASSSKVEVNGETVISLRAGP